jgi:hypothetical protein
MKTTWTALWNAYPNYKDSPDSEAVKAAIGGEVTEDWLGPNSCAIRMSHALNRIGYPVPNGHPGLLTVKGGDGYRYAVRVAETRKWLAEVLGTPDFDLEKTAGEPFDKAQLSGMKGIIVFHISFSDATGRSLSRVRLTTVLGYLLPRHPVGDHRLAAASISGKVGKLALD